MNDISLVVGWWELIWKNSNSLLGIGRDTAEVKSLTNDKTNVITAYLSDAISTSAGEARVGRDFFLGDLRSRTWGTCSSCLEVRQRHIHNINAKV